MAETIFLDEWADIPVVDLSDAKVEGERTEPMISLKSPTSFSIEATMSKDTKRFWEHYRMLLQIKQTAQIRLRNRFDIKKRI